MTDPATEVDLPLGVVSFDGRVVEIFGFGFPESKRAHVRTLESIGIAEMMLVGTSLELKIRGAADLVIPIKATPEQRAALDGLIADVQAAVFRPSGAQ